MRRKVPWRRRSVAQGGGGDGAGSASSKSATEKCHFPRGEPDPPPSNTRFLGSTRVHTPNAIDRLSRFGTAHARSQETDTQADRWTIALQR